MSVEVPRLSLGISNEDKHHGVHLKKNLRLWDGVSMIIGAMIGAGIFISPKGVLLSAGSSGLSLIIWGATGILSLMGALCYAELGTMIPSSGGDYAYIFASLGELPAFIFLWAAMVVFVPVGNAVTALTFSFYALQPFWDKGVDPTDIYVRVLSAFTIVLLTAVNCYNVKWATRVQDTFAVTKLIASAVIVIAGIVILFTDGLQNFQRPFDNTNLEPGMIAVAFYSGLYSFAGWNYLNFVTEELEHPTKNLPKAIWISLPLVTVIFVLINFSYFIVLTKAEILGSNAVAVTFADKILGVMFWIMPLFVACSTFGALNGCILANSRIVFSGARAGHLPKILALINIRTYTPIPAILILSILTLAMLAVKDVFTLINFGTFAESMGWVACSLGLIVLRFKKPDTIRPIKVNLAIPIIFFITASTLTLVTLIFNPASEMVLSLLILLCAIPVYLIFIYWENKPSWMKGMAVWGTHYDDWILEESTEDSEQQSLLPHNPLSLKMLKNLIANLD